MIYFTQPGCPYGDDGNTEFGTEKRDQERTVPFSSLGDEGDVFAKES